MQLNRCLRAKRTHNRVKPLVIVPPCRYYYSEHTEPELCSTVRYQELDVIKDRVSQNLDEAKQCRCDANKTLLHIAAMRGDEEVGSCGTQLTSCS